jgi:hypothetical protein
MVCAIFAKIIFLHTLKNLNADNQRFVCFYRYLAPSELRTFCTLLRTFLSVLRTLPAMLVSLPTYWNKTIDILNFG